MASVLEVIEAGHLSTIQDRGRFGYQRFGISASGPMDMVAFRLANTLVGNDETAAAIEMTLAGATLKVCADRCHMAYAGAPAPIAIDGNPVPANASFMVERGATIAVGAMRSGLRGYLAVAGGILCDPVLKSRATHTRSGIGGLDGAQLKFGQELPVAPRGNAESCWEIDLELIPPLVGPVRVLLGPQDDMFTAAGIETLLKCEYHLSAKVDRMGCQLEGPRIEHRGDFNIVSDGIVNGSIQVPGNGLPIILLADRQTTGGYAKIATVISADLRKIAQTRPGEALRFEAVDAETAEQSALKEAQDLAAAFASIRPRASQPLRVSPDRLWMIDLLGGVATKP